MSRFGDKRYLRGNFRSNQKSIDARQACLVGDQPNVMTSDQCLAINT